MHRLFERMIDAFRPAEGPPPRTLLAFFRWALSGAWPGLTVAALASALAGAAEVASATLLGMVVDAVSDVISLKPEQIRPAPDFASSVDTAYIRGLGALGERMLIVVDIERLMLSSEMALVDEAAQ